MRKKKLKKKDLLSMAATNIRILVSLPIPLYVFPFTFFSGFFFNSQVTFPLSVHISLGWFQRLANEAKKDLLITNSSEEKKKWLESFPSPKPRTPIAYFFFTERTPPRWNDRTPPEEMTADGGRCWKKKERGAIVTSCISNSKERNSQYPSLFSKFPLVKWLKFAIA